MDAKEHKNNFIFDILNPVTYILVHIATQQMMLTGSVSDKPAVRWINY